mgnify:CR=1 FL=1
MFWSKWFEKQTPLLKTLHEQLDEARKNTESYRRSAENHALDAETHARTADMYGARVERLESAIQAERERMKRALTPPRPGAFPNAPTPSGTRED